MTTEEKYLRIEEMLKTNEAFAGRVADCSTTAEVRAMFAAEGIDLTEAELAQAIENATACMKSNGLMSEDGELTSEALDMVAGGKNTVGWGIVLATVSAVVGFGPGIALGAMLVVSGCL